jgi:hypothetical protein
MTEVQMDLECLDCYQNPLCIRGDLRSGECPKEKRMKNLNMI